MLTRPFTRPVARRGAGGTLPNFVQNDDMADYAEEGVASAQAPAPPQQQQQAPMAPAAPASGAGGGALSMFQRSVNKERAMNAYRAAVFAANAPAPGPAAAPVARGPFGPENGGGGRPAGQGGQVDDRFYTPSRGGGPFGPDDGGGGRGGPVAAAAPGQANAVSPAAPEGAPVPAPAPAWIDRNSAAARKAFIATHMAMANAEDFGGGQGFFQRMEHANDANSRANATNAADVGYTGARTRAVDADTSLTPNRGRLIDANSGRIEADTRQVDNDIAENQATRGGRVRRMGLDNDRFEGETPHHLEGMRQDNVGKTIENTTRREMRGGLVDQIAAGNYATRRNADAAGTAAGAQATAAGAQATAAQGQKALAEGQARALTQRPPVDPVAAANAAATRWSLAQQMGKTAGEARHRKERWFPNLTSSTQAVGEETQRAYEQLNAQGGAGGGQAPASYSQADLEHTAALHGISVDEVKKRLGQQK